MWRTASAGVKSGKSVLDTRSVQARLQRRVSKLSSTDDYFRGMTATAGSLKSCRDASNMSLVSDPSKTAGSAPPAPPVAPVSKMPNVEWKKLLDGCGGWACVTVVPQLLPDGSWSTDMKHHRVRETALFVEHVEKDGAEDEHELYMQYRLWCMALRTGQYACSTVDCPVRHSGGRWLGRLIPLRLYRINHRQWDDRLENLRLFCPNCFSQQRSTATSVPVTRPFRKVLDERTLIK